MSTGAASSFVLSAEDRQLFDLLLLQEGAQGPRIETIPRRPDTAAAPLSFGQQRLWFLDRLEPGQVIYNLFFALAIAGDLDRRALRWALAMVASRHEILRTTFALQGERPMQRIGPPAEQPLPCVDLTMLPAARLAAERARLARCEARRPLDLERGPLWRAALVIDGYRHQSLLLAMHHIVADGWSHGILTGEVAALYRQATTPAAAAALPELPIQYGDFAIWQRERAAGEVYRGHLAYWQERLAGFSPLELPCDRPRQQRRGRGSWFDFRLPDEPVRALRSICERQGATIFMGLLAVFESLLARYCGVEDLLIGSPSAGRTRVELEPLIGFFVNNLVLRTDFAGNPSLRQLLDRVREVTLGAFAHEELPFDRLVEALRIDRTAGRPPLFDVVFAFQAGLDQVRQASGLALSPWWVDMGTAKFELTFSITTGDAHTVAAIEFDRDLFDTATIRRFAAHFRGLLAALVAAPDRGCGEAPWLGEPERHQLVVETRPALDAPPSSRCLHEMFACQAERSPAAVAASHENRHLSYGELHRRGGRLARRLRLMGARPETLVGVLVGRSFELLTAILGTLEAGAAYLPLDTSWPADRLAFVLADAGAAILLTDLEHRSRVPPGCAAAVLVLDREDREDAAGGSASGPDEPSTALGREDAVPRNTAYVIYTSGSTGAPKGVAVSHENVVRLFSSTQPWFGFDGGDVWTLFHSAAFDFSVWELWGALLHGGRLVIVPRSTSRSPADFHALLRRERVTVLNITPTAFRGLAAAAETAPADELALRYVIFGGEALDPRHLEGWWRRHGDLRPQLINMYGITETTVHVTYRALRTADLAAAGSPIGKPIPDLAAYVLDAAGLPAPLGAPGEICVAGPGLARGYLHRPELTAARFTPDAWSGRPGSRLYRSGDLGRRLARGEIEYLGRIDSQVKIRGFRVELGEIEAALRQCPGVREAVVVARPGAAGVDRLVAYLVAAPAAQPTPEELRRSLRRTLTEAMIPAAYEWLPALPLTVNGKLDRRALPAPAADRPELGQLYVEPSTPIQEALAGIWARALGLERVGVDDNFFALGGDSILSVRVIALAQQRGLEVSLPALFEHQTVAALALHLGGATPPAACERSQPFSLIAPDDRPLLPAGIEDAYPLSSLQAGMLYHMQLTPDYPLYHNVNSFHLRAHWDAQAFAQAVQRVVARHPVLRTSFDLLSFSEPLQLVHRDAVLPILVEDLRGQAAADQETVLDELVESEKRRGLELSRPPLLRFHVHRRGDDTFQLTLTENHAILDGWSLQSTLAEIFNVYRALAGGREPEPEAPVESSFREYIRLERLAVASGEQRAFWARRLSATAPGRLPRRSGPPPMGPPIIVRSAELAGGTMAGLLRLARELALPLKSLFLAAHLRVMARLTASDEVLTGLVTNGRPEEADGETSRGLFLNTVPFWARLEGGTWESLAQQAFRGEIEVLPYRRFPLGALQQSQQGESMLPTCFNYVHFHQLAGVVGGEDLEVLASDRGREETNFELLANFLRTPLPGGTAATFTLHADRRILADSTIDWIFKAYLRALAAMADDSRARYELDPLLSGAEIGQLIAGANPPSAAGAGTHCLHELFARQAARTPAAPAIVDGRRQICYGDLDRRAGRLAAHLAALGVGPEVRVGIAMHRCLEMVVGLLAILKAGGVYVPLDPAYPRERLELIMEDSGARLVLTDGTAPLAAAGRRLLPFGEAEAAAAVAGEPPAGAPAPVPANGAYVIYTSGSTGRPKGVLVTHANVCRLFAATRPWFEPCAADVWTLFHSYAFDFSVWEMWGALLAGGRLVIVPHGISRSPAELLALLATEGVTVLSQTPAAFRQLIAAMTASANAAPGLALRLVVFGGEMLDPASLRPWIERHGDRRPRLVNMYGITETTVHVTYRQLLAADLGGGSVIGQPIPDLRLYLLDRHLQPVPAGVAGEIHVGGAGLARGYLNKPELTAARFGPDPWSRSPGERLYRTGDTARYLASGDIEYIGRLDHQVKVRGFRIELGEIEQTLLQHPGVRAAVVMLQQGGSPDDRRLVAAVTGGGTAALDPAELRHHLGRHLPAYMIPALIAVLDEMPITASGKIDAARLAAMMAQPVPRTALIVAPRTTTEQVLAGLWSELLGNVEVGAEDSFFDLGGHSLLAMQLIGRVRELFQVEMPLQALLEGATVAELARRVDAGMTDDRDPLPEIAAMPRTGPLPTSFAQRQLWFAEQMEPGTGRHNVPVALRLDGVLDPAALRLALATVVSRHEILRTTFVEVDGEPMQVPGAAPDVAVPIVDLAGLAADRAESETARLAGAEGRQPFSLGALPLLRWRLLRLDGKRHVLLFTLHHIVTDAHSMALLTAEIGACYEALRTGGASPLPAPALHYGDFAAWQRRSMSGTRRAAHLGYWRTRLAGAPPTLDLGPAPGAGAAGPPGVTLPAVVDAGLAGRLRLLARRSRATLFMTLLTAFKVVLRHAAGRDDILVGSPVSLRDRRETEAIIGPFLNLLPLRSDLGGNPSFGELLDRVRQTTLQASSHRALPFDQLVDELAPERHQGRPPLVQVAFTLQTGAPRVPRIEGLRVDAMELDRGESTFELTLNLSDTGAQLRGFFEYRTAALSSGTVHAISAGLAVVLARIVEAPEPRLDELAALLAESGRQSGEARRQAARKSRAEALRGVKRRPSRNADARG